MKAILLDFDTCCGLLLDYMAPGLCGRRVLLVKIVEHRAMKPIQRGREREHSLKLDLIGFYECAEGLLLSLKR